MKMTTRNAVEIVRKYADRDIEEVGLITIGQRCRSSHGLENCVRRLCDDPSNGDLREAVVALTSHAGLSVHYVYANQVDTRHAECDRKIIEALVAQEE